MVEKLNILHLCEHFGGKEASLHGVARSFQWWIPTFNRNRYNIILCSRKGHDRAYEEMVDSGITPLTLGYNKLNPANMFALLKLCSRQKIDIIHAHGFGACLWGRFAGALLGIPVIVHGRANYLKFPWFLELIERVLGPKTNYALAVSESTKQFMVDKRHIPSDRVKVFYNGILSSKVTLLSEESKLQFKRELAISEDTFVIGAVGRLVTYKGFEYLIRGAALLKERGFSFQVLILGDGEDRSRLEQITHELGLDKEVSFLGFRRDAIDLIQIFDVQVFPSFQEGTPNTLFEAMLVGNCIVATPTDGQGEILEEGKSTLFFPPKNSKDLAMTLEKVMNDPPLRSSLRKEAKVQAKELDGRNTIKKMEALYEDIISKEKEILK